jgi:hypothetical protein
VYIEFFMPTAALSKARALFLLSCALWLWPTGPAQAAESWSAILNEYKLLPVSTNANAWATNMARALFAEFPEWTDLTNVTTSSNLQAIAAHLPEGLYWRHKPPSNPAPSAIRAVQYSDNTGLSALPVPVLRARGQDLWLWLNPYHPKDSRLGPASAIQHALESPPLLAPTNYFNDILYGATLFEIEPAFGNGRILQVNATNVLWGRSEESFDVSLPPELSNYFAQVFFPGVTPTNGIWRLSLRPTNYVKNPFKLTFRQANSVQVIAEVDNLLAGQVWLLAGGLTAGLPRMNPSTPPAEHYRFLEAETRIASAYPDKPPNIRTGGWTNFNDAPALVCALAEAWSKSAVLKDMPLGLILVSAGATDISPWQVAAQNTGASTNESRAVTNLWIAAAPGTNVDQYNVGDIYRGTLVPLLWPEMRTGLHGENLSFDGVIWMHGEWPASQLTNEIDYDPDWQPTAVERNYRQALTSMISAWRGAHGAPLRFLVTQLPRPSSLRWHTSAGPDPWLGVQLAQRDVETIADTRVVSLAGIESSGLHMTNFIEIANRIIPWLETPAPPVTVTNAHVSQETNIVIQFSQPLSSNGRGTFFVKMGDMVFTNSVSPTNQSYEIQLPMPVKRTAALHILHLGGLTALIESPYKLNRVHLPIFQTEIP